MYILYSLLMLLIFITRWMETDTEVMQFSDRHFPVSKSYAGLPLRFITITITNSRSAQISFPLNVPTPLPHQVDQTTGKLQLVSTSTSGETSKVTLPKVTGFKEYDTTTRKTQMVSFTDSGFQGKVKEYSDFVKISQVFLWIFLDRNQYTGIVVGQVSSLSSRI